MTQEHAVDDALALLRHQMQSVQAPPALEAALAARFRRQHRAPRPLLWWMPPLALAATVAVVSWMVRAPLPAALVAVPSATQTQGDESPFLALKPLERIALEPGSTVVTTEFPRALLADWGLPVSPDRAGEHVRAEMLYSPEGEALAIRLIN